MSNFRKAADDIGSLVNKLKPLFELKEFLDGVGSVEQLAHEANIRKENALKEAEKASESLKQANARLEVAEAKIEAAHSKAFGIENGAKEKVASLLAEAKIESAKIIAEANAYKQEVDHKFSAACKELASVQAELAGKKNELEDVKEQFNSILNKFKALVGG